MIEGLKAYPSMKDSGLRWLGEIPSHWDVRRAKYFYRESDERSSTGEEELLSVSHITGVTPRSQKNISMFLAESTVGYKLCRPGDVVVNTMWAWMAALGIARQSGLVSPSYAVYRPNRDSQLVDEYADHLLRVPAYANEYFVASTGINSSRLRLYPEQLLRLRIVCPPSHEQRQIVRFLNHADSRMRRYIRSKQKLVKLLKEQKRVIVHRAVTRGLDPSVRMKPAGEWIGSVPEHWSASRVKAEFSCVNNRRIALSGSERGNMTLRLYDYYGASGVIDKVDDFLFDDELLLIAEDGANLILRNLPLAIVARGKFWVNNHAHILKPRRGNIEYLAALMESIDYRPWISGAAQPKLTQDRLMSIPITVPPPSEQDHIVNWLDRETTSLSVAIQSTDREIDLLREYRTRLLADIVTGKVDVREAAERLPEDASDTELVYEADTEEAADDSAQQVDELAEEAEA